MNKSGTIRGTVFVGMLLFALACFMIFNYLSTLETLKHILGADFLVYAFAIALSLVDFAGLARIFTPETSMERESKFIYILGAVWLLACFFDVFMTVYWVDLKMVERNNGAAVQGLMGNTYQFIPWIIAIGELTIRVPLVLMVGMFGDQFLHGLDNLIPAMMPKKSIIPSRPISKPSFNPTMRVPQTMPIRPPQPTEPSYHPITFGEPK